MTIYNEIGKTYNHTRRADARITQILIEELKLDTSDATILDIGAGTGNYSYELANHGFDVVALEPSEIMRNQGKQHQNLTWVDGFAENIPLEDHSVDGIVCTLATHHFKDLALCFREMKRVVKENGRIIVFTVDLKLFSDDFWILEYFEPLIIKGYRIHPPLESLKELVRYQTGRQVHIRHFPLPHDLQDHFFCTGWRRPELYLDVSFQAGVSPLSKANDEIIENCLKRLESDLKSGKWHEKYGDIKKLNDYECGHFFLIV